MTTPAVDRAARRFKRSMQRIADESGGTVTMRAGDGPEVTVAAPRTDGEVTDATDGGFWGEVVTGPLAPVTFQTSRKGLSSALTRTQHAHSGDEARPVLQSWWLTVAGDTLTIHTADNYRLARATVSVDSQGDGWFGIHRSEAKALLAFLASGPDDVAFEAGDGAWSVHHEDGRLTGRLSPGTPPDWSSITEREGRDPVSYALDGRFASDAAKAAIGASGIVHVDYVSADRPTVWRSDGYSEWVMPVRIGRGSAVADDDDPPSHQDDTP